MCAFNILLNSLNSLNKRQSQSLHAMTPVLSMILAPALSPFLQTDPKWTPNTALTLDKLAGAGGWGSQSATFRRRQSNIQS